MSSDTTTNGRGHVTLSISSSPSSQLVFLNDKVHFNVWTPTEVKVDVVDSKISPVQGWWQNCSQQTQEKYQTSRLEVTALISDGNENIEADVLQIVGHEVSVS